MKIIQDTTTGKVIVEYCSTHNSHSTELAHLPVPQDVQYKIAAKLHDGVSIEKVLDSIRDDMSSGVIGREQLVSRQDILNIKKKLI